jgi:hypothetical protein
MVGKAHEYKYSFLAKMRYTLSVRDPMKCPRCGMGRDTDGDGDCAVCARFVDKRDVTAAIFRMLKRSKDATRKQA